MVTDNNRCTEGKLLALKSALLFFEDDNARSTNVTRLRLVDIRPGERSFVRAFVSRRIHDGIIPFETFRSSYARSFPDYSKSRTMMIADTRRKYSNVKEGTASTFSSLCFCCTGWNNESTERKAVPLNGVEQETEREKKREERESSSMFNIQ